MVRERKSRKGRNPKTGQTINIPETKVPAFKFSASLKGLVSGKK
jgi:DNA-binding protein HU-beta